MAQPSAAPGSTARSQRTRAAILAAAEALFSERGFDATRLEDVAERVGIRRASIVYYFKDKRELYDSVLESVFGELTDEIEAALLEAGDPMARIEAAIHAWVDYVGARPALARLLLREVAGSHRDGPPALAPHTRRAAAATNRFVREARTGLPRTPRHLPAQLASTIAGATVFYVAALPALVPDMGFDPLRKAPLRAHREAMVEVARLLLGRSA